VLLRNALPYVPADAVVVGVVDPEVGTERRAVALSTAAGRVLVGPDNGLLSLAAARDGGVAELVEIGRSPFRLEPVAATFHGRDLFAPVAAHLACGASLADAGDPLDPAELTALELPAPRRLGGTLIAHAITIDGFGNVTLNVGHEDLAGSGLKLGRHVEIKVGGKRFMGSYGVTFTDVGPGEVIVYEDASRSLALAVNRDSAADMLGVVPDVEIRLRPVD
jgi:S-adenosylmethionine hydrolase